MAHHELVITPGASLAANSGKARVGDTFRISYPGNGFTFRYTAGFPFQTADSLDAPRVSGETQTAMVVGRFPFDCFLNGAKVPVAGEIIVDPGA